MSSTRNVPPNPSEQPERLQTRPAESAFARLPADEVHPTEVPGTGPAGTIDTGPTNWALALVAVGFAVVFLAFAVDHWVPVVLGVALMIIGGVWAGARSDGLPGGLGRTEVEATPHRSVPEARAGARARAEAEAEADEATPGEPEA